MKLLNKALAALMVFAMVMSTMIAFDVTPASAKVKSVKATKKVSVNVGKTKTVKVKVKTTGKTSKKFTVKASKKKIVKVTIKKNKIKIKGLKAGTVKLTVKSKANKKKKTTIKVTVVKPDVKPELSVDVRVFSERIYRLTFSKEVNLSPSNIEMKVKVFKNGSYKKSIKLLDLSTTDRKVYTIMAGDTDYLVSGYQMKITIKGVTSTPIEKEFELCDQSRLASEEYVYRVSENANISKNWAIEEFSYSGFGEVKKVTGLPAGLKYTNKNGYIYLNGTIGKTGVYPMEFSIEDEKGFVFILRVVFVVGNEHTITLYTPTKRVCISDDGEGFRYGATQIYISGGSGSYTVKTYDDAGIFLDNPEKQHSGYYIWDFETTALGNKTGTFTVEDNNSGVLKTTGKSEVQTKKAIRIKGKVVTLSGAPLQGAAVRALSQKVTVDTVDTPVETDENGHYEMQVPAGTYDMFATYNYAYSFVYDKNITTSTTQDFTLSLCKIKITKSDPSLDTVIFGLWKDEEGESNYGYGSEIYVKPGTYKLHDSGTSLDGRKYNASLNFTAKTDMTVVANVEATAPTAVVIDEDTTHITATNKDEMYYTFIPKETGEYWVRTQNKSDDSDPDIEIYDSDGYEIAEDDNMGDIDLTVKLKAGQKYYFIYWECGGAGCEADLVVTPRIR